MREKKYLIRFIYKASGATYRRVVNQELHAFPFAPKEASEDEFILLSKNREDCALLTHRGDSGARPVDRLAIASTVEAMSNVLCTWPSGWYKGVSTHTLTAYGYTATKQSTSQWIGIKCV